MSARVAYDNYYIDNWSLRLELRTLALTVIEVLRFRGDRPPRHQTGRIRGRVSTESV